MKLTALLLLGFSFIPFSTAHSPSLPKYVCNLSTSLLFTISLYITQPSANSLITYPMFFQISFMYARNKSGPNTLPCGTPDVTLTPSDNCPPTLTVYVRPTRDFLIHRTTLSSILKVTVFVSSQSWSKLQHSTEWVCIHFSSLHPS